MTHAADIVSRAQVMPSTVAAPRKNEERRNCASGAYSSAAGEQTATYAIEHATYGLRSHTLPRKRSRAFISGTKEKKAAIGWRMR